MERPPLPQREAAAACGVSLSTIRRHREAGRFPGAQRDPARGWLIPVEDLRALLLLPPAPAPREGKPPAARGGAGADPVDQETDRMIKKVQRVLDRQSEHTIALAGHTAALDRLEKGQEELLSLLRQLQDRER
ncbi:helix-turn-helix transcriptional regulator [Streptomyces sp. H39-C1]|uniref:helix-turn-helix transcriptional regulator n=1 Tax=Streptomyces sp. H39-C1 TaxID=3004355 RepID=UPI0022AFCC51|nr:helix-turn-helix domain-containing protein [Streptomyces sp. H39-C1]MCZ4103704.1 helix-turn-helix domain-containing protein [Streptomyces sp. H39-C1]